MRLAPLFHTDPQWHPLLVSALALMQSAHKGQKRKYTGAPYDTHPFSVARIVNTVTSDGPTVIAALLHDVLEDTPVPPEKIRRLFGYEVLALVRQVTDVSLPTDGNRTYRKHLDLLHLEKATAKAKTIKLADLIDNSSSIAKYDPKFAKIYMAEKRRLLPVLTEGNAHLLRKAQGIVDAYFANNS